MYRKVNDATEKMHANNYQFPSYGITLIISYSQTVFQHLVEPVQFVGICGHTLGGRHLKFVLLGYYIYREIHRKMWFP